ncbi:HSPB1-associated protein 1 [Rhagoletis pomonella]|uniref:HSPB1-associated protein 1 n=1 Tax=Rhagoletis pomonella TaxID=28610 RepID=UPI00177E1B1E|nr:HSPB1-associated protein 1 [Rhagoletis pomonella]
MAAVSPNFDAEALKLRTVILNARKPLVLRNFKMNWKCFDQTIEGWCSQHDDEVNSPIEFEIMAYSRGNPTPHWERNRKSIHMTLKEFLEKQKTTKSDECWIGLNYKRVKNLPTLLQDGIDFSKLGFSEATAECNYWLCSAQTNTPCHYDTYGCNIVVQVYGRKSWLLYPPKTPLTCTRIPYEESSIYCEENIFAPNAEELQQLSHFHNSAYRCILNPNDVLIVPKHWWHYVEAMDVSLSINYWIPLENDIEDQLKECIVKILVERFVLCSSKHEQNLILNPNQVDEIQGDPEIFEILNYLYENSKPYCPKPKSQRLNVTRCRYQCLDENEWQELVKELPKGMVECLTLMPKEEYESLLDKNSQRLKSGKETTAVPNILSHIKKALINSVCDPLVIENIKSEFLKRYKL